ncbi:hypothetical protein C3Z09_21950 [Lelliottia aquatilis]|uniref:hypothetical protein n=1 Tax=Lelliottia aquatilis TaxID=2080838 RepID=UPI000CDF175D|nr:hypothetical protein [Lelliottia aquatilis]POZ13689.1 hypothetical protein C3Z09_21950 [Lelliottia aquatilis]
MKILKNEFEYRNWMAKNYLCIEDTVTYILSPDEVEEELLRQMPEQFPCILLIVAAKNPSEYSAIYFLYRSQIQEWAIEMGITSNK